MYLRTITGLFLNWLVMDSMGVETTEPDQLQQYGGIKPGPPDYKPSTLPPEL